jgi:PAS domain S-box-containing protein
LRTLSWFVILQSSISAGLVALLWLLHARLGRRPFFKWWAWAWAMFALYLALGAQAFPLSADWSRSKAAALFLATLCGHLQPVLLIFGAVSLQTPQWPARRWRIAGLALGLAAGTIAFATSLAFANPIDSLCVRLAPRAWALGAAAALAVVVFVRRARGTRSATGWATAGACLLYTAVQAAYGVAATGRLVAGDAAPLAAVFAADASLRAQLFLFDIITAYGICLGIVLLLVEEFQRSMQSLGESLRLRRQALEENAVLQAEIHERRRVERALRESEDRYRDLVEHSEDLICTHDLEGHILSVNAAPARILGYDTDEITGRLIQDFVVPEERALYTQYVAGIVRDGAARGSVTVLTREGDPRIWEFRNTLRTEGVPSPVVRGMAHDVTERVQAERALRLSQAKFAAAFRTNPCSVAISRLEDGRILEVNDSCEQQTGYLRSEIIGRTALELGLWVDQSARAAIVAELKAGGKVSNREVRWRSKAGRELTILYSADTITMDDQTCLLSVAMDITAHKQVEARHRAILRALPDWIFLTSRQGVYIDCHVKDRRYLLAEPEAFIGQTLHDTLPRALADDLTRLTELVARTDETGTLEYSVPVRGEVRHYEVRAVQCEEDRILSIVRDVTEAKRTELHVHELRRELAHISRVTTLSALAGSLAHEICQPLTGMRTTAQAALRLLVQPDTHRAQLREALCDIIADSERAADVIQRLRSMLRREPSGRAPVDLNLAVEEVLRLLQFDLKEKSIALTLELQPDLPPVLGDRVQLQQVVLNLLINACDAVESQLDGSRRIQVRTSSQHGAVTLAVTDHGIGLADEQIGRLFEPFYTTKSDGMGLGLWICEMIMADHDGRISVKPNGGPGVTFSFELPELSESPLATDSRVMPAGTLPRAD